MEEAEINRDMQRHLNKNKGDGVSSGRWKTNKDKWTPFNHNKNNQAGKGDTRRTSDISKEEYDLRWDLALGNLTEDEKIEVRKMLEKIKENK